MAHITGMRSAFVDAVFRVLNSPRAVKQEKLVKRVVRVIDNGAGLFDGRSVRRR